MWTASSPAYKGLWVWLPKTWLLREGWRRHGRIGARDVPGGAAMAE